MSQTTSETRSDTIDTSAVRESKREATPPLWVVMPVLGAEAYTDAAISDVLAQSIPTRLLLINQGVATPFRQHLERIAEEYPERVFLWSHCPSLPSLAATWNRALDFVWACGGEEALVANNDLRLAPWTVEHLSKIRAGTDALFVSAVGVVEEQFKRYTEIGTPDPAALLDTKTPWRGGPDFSCFLVSRACHEKYRFDEGFTPAFCEDLDLHRRMMLGGDSARIFSANIPYLHYSSQTLKTSTPEARAQIERRIAEGSRAHYARKWGGGVNAERYTIPFEPRSAQDGVTTPDLQRACAESDRVEEERSDDGQIPERPAPERPADPAPGFDCAAPF